MSKKKDVFRPTECQIALVVHDIDLMCRGEETLFYHRFNDLEKCVAQQMWAIEKGLA